MGNTDTKLNFRKAVVQLTTKTQPVEAGDDVFWSQFWSDSVTCVQDMFTLIPAAEIRALREENPSNLATLCYKAVEKLVHAGEAGCRTQRDQQIVLNCLRLLTRILPYIFEDPDWRGFFWSTLPGQGSEEAGETDSAPLAQSLINALCDLMFCPEFTVAPNKKTGPDNPEDMATIDSCEYIWQAGVGFAHAPPTSTAYDQHRNELLKLLLTCFSESMYLPPVADAHNQPNQWIAYFTSTENRHALPLFTSLLNTVCAYDPVGYGVPYNHLMFSDHGEPLVEGALQVLTVTLDNEPSGGVPSVDGTGSGGTAMEQTEVGEVGGPDNLFVNYLSRIHREEDFGFILKGLTRLLNNPLMQTYLPGSCRRIQFHQELLVLFWKMCDVNKKFMFYVLKSSDVLDVLVPILYFLNDARADQSRVGLMHIGVFILLLLSGERNFGVRLNKPYTVRVPMDIPVFTGTHADFLIIVFHKIITTGHQRLQPLFDCLLTIIVNVSPYLKTLSMVASTKMLHLLEAFSTPWFLYASPTNHHLVFFLLEVFNNIIQYQFDGNANLVYTIIRKRNVFHQLANLPTDHLAISKALTKRGKKFVHNVSEQSEGPSMEGSTPAMEAEPGTLNVTLAATPAVPTHTEWFRTPAQLGNILSDDLWKETDLAFTATEEAQPNNRPPLNFGSMDKYLSTERILVGNEERSYDSLRVYDLSLGSDRPNFGRSTGLSTSSDNEKRPRKLYRSESVPSYSNVDLILKERRKWFSSIRNKSLDMRMTILEESQNLVTAENKSEVKNKVAQMLGIEKMTEKSPASVAHIEQPMMDLATASGTLNIQPGAQPTESEMRSDSGPEGQSEGQSEGEHTDGERPPMERSTTLPNSQASPTPFLSNENHTRFPLRRGMSVGSSGGWLPSPEWVSSWKQKLPLQTIMRLLQVLVPQVEKICIDKGLTDESEILKFLQHGTLVGLLPVPHPILIRKYQANSGTTMWFRTYMWGVIYLRNVDPPIWYDTDVKLFEIQRV